MEGEKHQQDKEALGNIRLKLIRIFQDIGDIGKKRRGGRRRKRQ